MNEQEYKETQINLKTNKEIRQITDYNKDKKT